MNENLKSIRELEARINQSVLGQEHVAFAEVKLSDTREKALAEFNAAIQSIPEIEQCHMIAGSFDYLLKIRTSDIQAYRRGAGRRTRRPI